MRPHARALVPLLVIAAVAACHRHSGPSPELSRASAAFSRLYAEKLDDAFLDPAIPSILEDLHRVRPDSIDAAEAHALEARITSGRDRMQQEQEARNRASEKALQAVDNVESRPSAPSQPATLVSPPDAGLSQPAAGMSRTEFEQRFLGCFQSGAPVDVQGRGVRDSYELKDIGSCRDRHPGFDKSIVLMEGKSVLGVMPRASVIDTIVDAGIVDAGPPPPLPPLQDAGVAR